MLIRIRIYLPRQAEWTSLVISFGLHLLLVTVVLVAGTRSGAQTRPLPAMTVRLSAGSPVVTKPQQPRSTSKPKPAATKPDPPKEKPAKKPSRRTRADAPTTVADAPESVTAEPEDLPEADLPPEEPSSTEPDSGEGVESDETLPQGPIPGGVAGVETDQAFAADWYVQLIVARLTEAWRDRPVLPAGSPARRVIVAFSIERDGSVTGSRVHLPSGYSPLDYSAQRAVTSLKRLPPLPRSYNQDSLSARFVFELLPPGAR